MITSVDPIAGLAVDLETQRDFVATRAPVYAHLLDALRGDLDHHAPALAEAWAGRRFGAFYERPLLILASLRDDALATGPDHPLWSAIAAPDPDPAQVSVDRLRAALERERPWRSLRERHVQTNETSRAVAWLWPAHLCARADPDRSLALHDIGASAGLNLIADELPAMWTAGGAPLSIEPRPPIAGRTGYDPRPLDVRDPDDARWLRACVWPGQTERLARLDAGIEVLRHRYDPVAGPRVVTLGAGDVPGHIETSADRPRTLCYQTVVRDYLPAEERARYEAGMRARLEDSPAGAILWIELEVTDAARAGGPPAAITAHLRGSDGRVLSLVLAHCEPHPVVLDIDEHAVRALVGELG